MPHNFLAIDLGAESGRAILATLDGEQLSLTDIHRFPNGPVRLPDGLHWDILRL
jgi:sugar (pentulose or hexulose) kinase